MSLTLNEIESKLRKFKIVPVIALDNEKDILPLADTLAENGLPIAEITFRSSLLQKLLNYYVKNVQIFSLQLVQF